MNNMNQKGRSMVEMLGVLAIVGVLSVGAIAGYSKAMFKYKMNKTMDMFSHAFMRLAELETMNLGDQVFGGSNDMLSYGIMPECDQSGFDNAEQDTYCPFPFGYVALNSWQYGGQLEGGFQIYFNKDAFNSCVAFLSSDIYKNIPAHWSGFREINRLNKTPSEITAADVLDICQGFSNGENSYISLDFNGEYDF